MVAVAEELIAAFSVAAVAAVEFEAEHPHNFSPTPITASQLAQAVALQQTAATLPSMQYQQLAAALAVIKAATVLPVVLAAVAEAAPVVALEMLVAIHP